MVLHPPNFDLSPFIRSFSAACKARTLHAKRNFLDSLSTYSTRMSPEPVSTRTVGPPPLSLPVR
jgi:hypothetical protein